MAKAMRRLQKKVRAEQAQIAKAAKKRGLWSSLGSALVGGVAMLATGGAASPFVAGLFAGGAHALGGHLGNYLAGQSSGGKIKGGRFFQGQRDDIASQIKEGINTGAVKAAFKAGRGKLIGRVGGKLKLGKAGVLDISKGATTATGGAAGATVEAGGKLSDKLNIFKGGESAHTYSDSLWGKIGETLDFKGSTLGKGLQHIQSKALERQFRKEGWIDPNLQGAAAEDGKPIVAMDRFEGVAKQRVADIREAQSAAMLTAAKQAPQIAESTIRQGARGSGSQSYLSKVGKVSSKYEGASEAQAKAVAGSEVPSWYGAPKGTTWGETAIDPGSSDLSYAGSYETSPDQVPYTGDVPDLMDLYQDDTSDPAELWRKQEIKKILPMEKMDVRGGPKYGDLGDMKKITGLPSQTQTYKSQEGLYSTSIPTSETALGMTSGQRSAYDRINEMTDAGYPPIHTKEGAYGLPEEYGRGYISKETGDIVRPPTRPDVPFEAPLEETFFSEPVGDIQDFDFSTFDEASWEEGRKTLSNIDFELADEQIPWQKRIFPDKKYSDLLRKPGGFDPRW